MSERRAVLIEGDGLERLAEVLAREGWRIRAGPFEPTRPAEITIAAFAHESRSQVFEPVLPFPAAGFRSPDVGN